jgi:hypothetical protein
MLATKSAQVYSDLSASTALTDLLTKGVNGIRPLLAEYEDGDSFVNYSIRFNGFLTKGRMPEIQLIVQSWAASYNKSVAIADAVANALLNDSGNYYTYESAVPTFNEQQEIYTIQTFNIKN